MTSVTPNPDNSLPFGGGTPATPCPAWCTVGQFHEDGNHFHTGDPVDVGPLRLFPEIRDDDTPAVLIHPDSADGEFLTLDEVDELIARLSEVRATLTGSAA